jgi:TIR domain-containing protein
MTDVFLSYSRADRPVAEAIAHELQRLGVDVWWDHDLLGGDDYRRRISDILTRVEAAIVIWSRRSVESQWVISEAAAARERKVLVPVTIDGQELPIDFRALHTTDLVSWVPGDRLPDMLLKALADRLGRELSYADAGPRSGAVARFAKQATQAWYLDFESLLFYFMGQGFACFLVNLPLVFLFRSDGPSTVVLPAWSPYLFALMNGVIVAALYMRPALETRRLGIAIPLFVLAAILSVVAYIGGLAVSIAGEREILILVGLATLALLFVTSLAQRATVRR